IARRGLATMVSAVSPATNSRPIRPDIALIPGPPADTVPRSAEPPSQALESDDGRNTSPHAPGTLVPGLHPRAAAVLGRAGLRDPAALRHGNGGGYVPSGDDIARTGAEAVEGRLCAAVAQAEGWPLRRKPQSPAALL